MDAGRRHGKIPLRDEDECTFAEPPGLRRRPRLDCDRTDPRLADGGRQELAAIDVTRLSAMSGHDL
jgi:hypothetical protein